MRLGSLRKIDELSTKKEIKILNEELDFLNKLIKNKNVLNKYIIDELTEICGAVDKSKILRRTIVNSTNISNEVINVDEFQEIEKMTIVLTKDGSLKTFRDHLDREKVKKSIENAILHKNILSNQKILLFVSTGRVYTIDPNLLPSGKSNPKNFIFYVESNSNDKLIGILPYEKNLKTIVASKFGKGFIADLNDIQTSQRKGKQLFNLKLGDKLISITSNLNSHIACVSNNSKILIFETKFLPILKKGGGVQLQKIKKDEALSDIQSFNLSDGVTWRIGSQLRSEKDINFWIGKRAQVGKKVPNRFNKNLKFFNE